MGKTNRQGMKPKGCQVEESIHLKLVWHNVAKEFGEKP